ncbi:MAG: hypothetical protein IJW17_06810 [Lentisphaeria bacterium]|nr:hypothetical protein [Lentisphaeria bacterium]
MKKLLTGSLTALILCASGGEAAGKLTVPAPAFAQKETKKIRNTFVVPGKSVFNYRGAAVSVRCFKSGTPQLYFSDPVDRFGGIVLNVNKKNLRGALTSAGNNCTYDFGAEGSIGLNLEKGGLIAFTVKLKSDAPAVISIPLTGHFFGDSKAVIDGKTIAVPPYVEKPKYAFSQLFKGSGRSVTFLKDQAGKEFSVILPAAWKMKLNNFNKARRLELIIEVPAGQKEFRFHVDPGFRLSGKSTVPADRIVKVGECDFWELDRYVLPSPAGKNLLQNSSFEQDFRYLIFRDRGRFNSRGKLVSISDKEAFCGKKSLQIRTAPGFVDHQPVSKPTVILPAGKFTLSFYAKTDAPGKQTLIARLLDPAFIWTPAKAPSLNVKLTGEWKRYSLTYEWKRPVAIPVVFSAVSAAEANCYIDAVMLENGDKCSPYKQPSAEGFLMTSAEDNFLEYGKKIDAAWHVISFPETPGKLRLKVRDFFDRVLLEKQYSFVTGKDGKAVIRLPEFETFPRGIFIMEADYDIKGEKRYDIQRFSIMSFLNNTHKNKDLFVDTYVDPYCPNQIFPDVLARYQKLGYGARAGFANNDEKIAKQHTEYNITNHICRIANAVKANSKTGREITIFDNIEYYMYPGQNKQKAMLVDKLDRPGPHSPEFLAQVEDAAARLAAASPTIKSWVFLTEPEGVMPEWANPAFATPERFRDFMDVDAAVGRGVRRGNPKALYFSSPTANISRSDRWLYFDRMLAEAKKRNLRYDGIAAHNYRYAPEYPTTLESDYLKVFAIMEKHGYKDVPVYSPEGMHWLPVRCRTSSFVSDYPISKASLHGALPYTYDLSFAEKLGTAYRARTYLLGLKYHDKIKLMNASNYQTFAMDALLTPFAFQKVPNTLGRLLGNARFVAEISLHPEVRCYLFEDENKRPVAALWACSEAVDFGESSAPELHFPAVPGLELWDLMEAQHLLDIDKKKNLRIPLSSWPVFLRGEKGSTKKLEAMLAKGICKATEPVPPTVKTALVSLQKLSLDIQNPENSSAGYELNFRGHKQKLTFSPKENKRIFFDLPQTLSAGKQNYYDIQLSLKKEKGKTFRYDRSFCGTAAAKTASPIIADGELNDWKSIPAIKMEHIFRSKKMIRQGKHPDPENLSGFYKIAWDKNGFYLAVSIRDSKHRVEKRSRIDQGWKDDSIQIFFDTFADGRNNKPGSKLGVDDWSYGIFPEHGTNKVNVWRYHCPDGQLTVGVDAAKPRTLADDVKAVFKRTEEGAVYELHFSPRSILPFALKAGKTLGVAVLVNDSDDDNETEPAWRLSNTVGKEYPNDYPELWPLIYLKD